MVQVRAEPPLLAVPALGQCGVRAPALAVTTLFRPLFGTFIVVVQASLTSGGDMFEVAGHCIWFLLGLALFPRIALLLFAATPFGWLAWIGWLVAPHLLVAVLSVPFWHSHPLPVILAWAMAVVGTGGEGSMVRR